MASIIVGAAIILIPLGLFLFVIARDLRSEEESLMRRIARLQEIYSSMKSGTAVGSSIADSMGLDEGDVFLIHNIAATLKAEDMIADDLAFAFNKVIMIRNHEHATLERKLKKIKIYSLMTMVVICVLLSLLLFVSALKP